MIKKALIILLCLLFCTLPLFSCGEVDDYEMIIDSKLLYGRSILSTMPNSDALIFAYDCIVAGVNKSAKEIAISNDKNIISADELKLVVDVYSRDHVEHFWFKGGYEYTYDGDKVIAMLPQYTMSGSKLSKAKQKLEEEVAKLLQGINNTMTDYEKELYLHDALAQKIVYKESTNAHNLYGAIVEGRAVCEGYAEAFQYLLNRAGISSFKVSGTSKNEAHAWNIVRIDGE